MAMQGDTIRRYILGSLAGFAIGVLIVHPFSMLFQGLVYPISGVDFGEVLKAFRPRHLPMAFFFGLLGIAIGLVMVFFLNQITQERQRIKVLEGLLPICSYCKKIRDDTGVEKGEGKWYEIEHYIASRSEADFTHGICRECYDKYIEKELEELEKSNP